jgi:hypothetical protein
MGKKMKKFNPTNWQGRSQRQVETNYKIMGWSMAVLLLFGILGILLSFINGLLA